MTLEKLKELGVITKDGYFDSKFIAPNEKSIIEAIEEIPEGKFTYKGEVLRLFGDGDIILLVQHKSNSEDKRELLCSGNYIWKYI